MNVSATDVVVCHNCGAPVVGRFCSQCGQKVAGLNPSVRDFLHELTHELLHLDGKIIRSVRLLLTAPGYLTKEQFEGRRVRYVSPIRLYLIFSVLYFAVAAFGPNTFVRVTESSNAEETQKILNEALAHWLPRVMFVLVPLFAGLVGIVTRRQGRNYPQHLYFALHVLAAWFLVGAITSALRFAGPSWLTSRWRYSDRITLDSPAALAGAVYAIVYLVLAFRRAYGLTTIGAVTRAIAVCGMYAVAVMAAIAAIVAPVIIGWR